VGDSLDCNPTADGLHGFFVERLAAALALSLSELFGLAERAAPPQTATDR